VYRIYRPRPVYDPNFDYDVLGLAEAVALIDRDWNARTGVASDVADVEAVGVAAAPAHRHAQRKAPVAAVPPSTPVRKPIRKPMNTKAVAAVAVILAVLWAIGAAVGHDDHPAPTYEQRVATERASLPDGMCRSGFISVDEWPCDPQIDTIINMADGSFTVNDCYRLRGSTKDTTGCRVAADVDPPAWWVEMEMGR
jgi:hypothetical protein